MERIAEAFFDPEAFARSTTLLWLGTVELLRLVIVAFGLALVVGVGFVAMAHSRIRVLRSLQPWLVDAVRALPPLVSLVIVFYLVPPIGGLSLGTFEAAVLTFAVVQGAYVSEIYRGGLRAIPTGQWRAATALGMSRPQAARLIVAPQVFAVILPPLTSQATQLVRDSSLTFFIGYEEVITRARQAVDLTSDFTPYTMAVGIYAALLVSLQLVSTGLERRRRSALAGLRP